jgi:hypothetical protein
MTDETPRQQQVREALTQIRVSPDPKRHMPGCRHRAAIECTVAIECDHGYDVCPTCDACTCTRPPR